MLIKLILTTYTSYMEFLISLIVLFLPIFLSPVCVCLQFVVLSHNGP